MSSRVMGRLLHHKGPLALCEDLAVGDDRPEVGARRSGGRHEEAEEKRGEKVVCTNIHNGLSIVLLNLILVA